MHEFFKIIIQNTKETENRFPITLRTQGEATLAIESIERTPPVTLEEQYITYILLLIKKRVSI